MASEPVVEITEAGAARLAALMAAGGERRALYLRVEPGGCSGFRYIVGFEPPEPPAEAVTVESRGVTLVIDAASLPMLQDSRVEYDRRGFSISNPHARMACNCGASFALPLERPRRPPEPLPDP